MKKTISLILCVAMIMSSLSFCFPALALELDFSVESNENYAPTPEEEPFEEQEASASLMASGTVLVPGVNILTGTQAAYNFNSLTSDDLKSSPYGTSTKLIFAIGNAQLTDLGSGNKAMRLPNVTSTSSGTYPHFGFMQNFPAIEWDRPLVISGKYQSNINEELVVIRNRDNMTTPVIGKVTITGDNAWHDFSTTVQSSTKALATNTSREFSDAWVISRLFFMIDNLAYNGNVLIDDLSIVPYYKVTYYGLDGHPIALDYIAPDKTSYNVDSTKTENGFATEKGGTTAVSNVTITGSDINLYAIAGNKGKPGVNLLTGTAAAYDFENVVAENHVDEARSSYTNKTVRKIQGVVDRFVDEQDNNYMRLKGGYPHFAIRNTPIVEADRPVEIDFKYKASASTKLTLIRNHDNMTSPVLASPTYDAAVDWTAAKITVKGADGGDAKKNGKATSTHPTTLVDDTKDIKNIIFMYNGNLSGTFDIDDVIMRPYYKVTLYDADGVSVLYSDYLDPDSTSFAIPASEALDTTIYKGYALKGTEDIVTGAITLANEDIELVAQLKEGAIQLTTGMPGVNVFTGDLKVYGFEDPAYKHTSRSPRDAGVETDPDNKDNKVLHIGAAQYSHASLTPMPVAETNTFYEIQFENKLEDERPFDLTFKVKGKLNDGATGTLASASMQLRSGQDNVKLNAPYDKGWIELARYTGMTADYADKKTTITMKQMKSSLGFPLLCFLNGGTTAQGYNFYIDDMKLVPHYAVTYYDADGTTVLHRDYFTPETKTAAVSATGLGKIDMSRYEGFVVKGTQKKVSQGDTFNLNYQDIELVAVLKPGEIQFKAGMPGINLWTRNPDAYGFEDITDATKGTKFRTVSSTGIRVKANSSNANNQAMVLSGNYPHFSTLLGTVPTVEKDRPVFMSYDYIATAGTTVRIVRNVMNKTSPSLNDKSVSASSSWKTHTATLTGSSQAVTNQKGGEEYNDDTQDIKNFWIMKNAGPGADVYIDNVKFVPYYKVTYYDYDGAVLSTKYISPNETKVTVPTLNSNYKGYALKGTTDIVTEVKLNYQDLEFVAVLKDGVQSVAPTTVTGYKGTTTDVDFRFPGVYYTFDEEIEDTTLSGVLEIPNAYYYELSTDKKTIIVYPYASEVNPGKSVTLGASVITTVKTVSGKFVKFPEATLNFAASIPNDYQNLVPFGDMEGAYIPFMANNRAVFNLHRVAHTESGKTGNYIEIRDNDDTANSGIWAYARIVTKFDEGATYKIYADVKLLGGAQNPSGGAQLQDNIFYANANHAAQVLPSASREWTAYEKQITATGLVANTVEYLSFYSNPYTYNGTSNGDMTEYAIDNYEVYKRVEVGFKANSFAPLKSGASHPVIEGKYLYTKGGVKNTDSKITLPVASAYYEATDARRKVSGWLGSNGVVYADGEQVDLAETLAITFEPNLVAADGYKFITVKFEGDVDGLPEAIKGTLEGDTIDLTDYYTGVTSAVSGKRFNGWSLTGEPKDIIDEIVIGNDLANAEDEIVVKAVVNYDWNFAIPANQSGWAYGAPANGYIEYKDDMMVGHHKSGNSPDIYFTNNSLAIPAGRVQRIIYMLDEDLTHLDKRDHSTATASAMKIVETIDANKEGVKAVSDGAIFPLIETLYFGQGHTRKAGYSISHLQVTDVSDGLAKLVVTFYDLNTKALTNNLWDVNKTLTTTDLDPNTNESRVYEGVGVRYIHYVDYPKYDTSTVAITELTAPETGKTPATTATASKGTVESVEWKDLSAGGLFKELTSYEVTLTLAPEAGIRYADDTVFTLDGATAVSTVINNDTDGTAIVTFKYNTATEAYKAFDFDLSTVSDIEVTSIDAIQLDVNITEQPADGVDSTVVWSIVNGADVAEITEDGLLTAYKAGTITVKAVSVYNENKAYTKDINITLSNDVKAVQISFTGDILDVPAVTRLAGTTIEMTDLYNATANATASAAGKRFNGWSTTGDIADLIVSDEWTVPEEDTTLYAIVNNDINFAIPANAALLYFSRGTVSYKNGMVWNEYTKNWTSPSGSPADIYNEFYSVRVPMAEYKGMEVYYLNEYTSYSSKAKEDPTPAYFTDISNQDSFYFSKTGGFHSVVPKISKIAGTDGNDYAVFTAIMSGHEKWIPGNLPNFVRLDPLAGGYMDFYIRYFRAIPYDRYEEDIEITLDAPATGVKPAESTSNSIAVIKSETISPTVPVQSGLYEELTAYKVTYVIEPADKTEYRFRDDVKVKVNGNVCTDVNIAVDGTVTASYTFTETLKYVDFTVSINGKDTIVADGRAVQYTGVINYTNVGDKLTTEELFWSVDDETVASFDPDTGMLTPYKAGTVTIKAQSKYNLAVEAVKTVTVELAPTVKEVQVTFKGADLAAPTTITRLSGTTLNLADFLTPELSDAAKAEGKRFNGWSTTNKLKDLTTEYITLPAANSSEDAVLKLDVYAMVNHDINFAIPANQTGWGASKGTVSYNNDRLVFTSDHTGSSADIIIEKNDFNIANVHKYAQVEFYFDKAYSISDKNGNKTNKVLTEGAIVEGIYFSRTGEKAVGARNVGGKVTGFAGANSAYAVVTHNMYTNDLWTGTLERIRFDAMNQFWNYNVRYIRFVEAENYDEDIAITAPVPTTGVAATTDAETNEIGYIADVTATPETFLTYTKDGEEIKNYLANTAYTLRYTVKAADESPKRFAADIAATVNGADATVVSVSENGREAVVEYAFAPTLPYVQTIVTITGDSEILTRGRATQYKARISAPNGDDVDIPTNSITWSLAPEDAGYATINSETGRLIPIRNANEDLDKKFVTVIATSNYDGQTATLNVQLKNQATEVKVKYDLLGGTPSDGSAGIAPTVGAGTVTLSTLPVSKPGYGFVGWATNDETLETVTTLTLMPTDDEDTNTPEIDYTVYAVWEKVNFSWEFNTQAEVDAFNVANAAHYVKRFVPGEGAIEFDITAAVDTYYYQGGLSIDSDKAKTIKVRILPNRADALTFYFAGNSIDGDLQNNTNAFAGHAVSKRLTAGVWNDVSFDLSSNPMWKATVTKVRYDFVDNNSLSTSKVDYIRFVEDKVAVTFDANAGTDTVTGLPGAGQVSIRPGTTFKINDVPTRNGYVFIGWSKTADGSTAVKRSFGIVTDVTLYAIWEPSNTTVEVDGSIVVGAIDPAVNEALVVETGAAGTVVTLLDDIGAVAMTATADESKFATFDVTTLTAPITNAVVTTDAGSTLISATLTNAQTAKLITSTGSSSSDSVGEEFINGQPTTGSDDSTSGPSTKVETITKPGKINPSTMYPEEEEEQEEEEFKFTGYPTVKTGENPFVDVSENDWFHDEVYSAYKLGFVEGKSSIVYDPDGEVTVAEAITFAVRLNYGYYGKTLPEAAADGVWYTPFVEAAIEAGIIKKTQFTDYEVPALRKQVAVIMAKSVPSEYLNAKNMFTSVPDANKKDSSYSSILKLYRAGVLIGSDAEYNFKPETKISRAEMSAIVNRIAIPANRKRIVTAEELEARKKVFYAEDFAEATLGNCYTPKMTIKGGYATGTGKSTDPIVYITPLVPDLNGAEVAKITIGLKTTAKADPQIYFTTPSGGWSAQRLLMGKQGATKEDGVIEYVFDTKTNSQFANKITGIRFDPFNAKDIEFSIAYIIFE